MDVLSPEADRSVLDGRRVRAGLLDGLICTALWSPLALVFGLTEGVIIAYSGITLAYFHYQEAKSGQTLGKRALGLRVVNAEGGAANAMAISGRTVFRLVDGAPFYVLGAIVMAISGRRRKRIGDLIAGTMVVDARNTAFIPAPRSPLLTIYPSVWLGAAFAFFFWVGPGGSVYLGQLDRVCKESAATLEAPGQPIDVLYHEALKRYRRVQAMGATALMADEHDETLRMFRIELDLIFDLWQAGARGDRKTWDLQSSQLRAISRLHEKRFQALGLKWCF